MKTRLQILAAALIFTGSLSHVFADETNYFLVARPRENDAIVQEDSYVLPLSKKEDIDHARYLISLGGSVFSENHKSIVGAFVWSGKDGINRNYFDRRLPEWSWHVEFGAFAEIMEEVYDGTPTLLENGFADWPHDDEGRRLIGFFSYTVIRELGPFPLYVSVIPDGQALQFYWSGLGTNYFYTLESKESLASTNWFTISGGPWPLKTNQWTLPQTNTGLRFFRVRAEQAKP